VLLQQLPAALAGDAAAAQLINSLTEYNGFDSWPTQHIEAIVNVVAAEQWQQQLAVEQQQQQQQQPATQVQHVGRTVVFAVHLLVRLLKHDRNLPGALKQRCPHVPPLLQRWWQEQSSSSSIGSSCCRNDRLPQLETGQ
jgi:hypothetical protein